MNLFLVLYERQLLVLWRFLGGNCIKITMKNDHRGKYYRFIYDQDGRPLVCNGQQVLLYTDISFFFFNLKQSRNLQHIIIWKVNKVMWLNNVAFVTKQLDYDEKVATYLLLYDGKFVINCSFIAAFSKFTIFDFGHTFINYNLLRAAELCKIFKFS